MRDWLQKCNTDSGRKLDFNPEKKIRDDFKHVEEIINHLHSKN